MPGHVFTSALFRKLSDWEKLKYDFEIYKNGRLPPNFGRDAPLDNPRLDGMYHIHLAKDDATVIRWAKINDPYRRTHTRKYPERDYWLIYAFNDFNGDYLLLTVVGPEAHHPDFIKYLRAIQSDIVEVWLRGGKSADHL